MQSLADVIKPVSYLNDIITSTYDDRVRELCAGLIKGLDENARGCACVYFSSYIRAREI